MRTPIVTIAAMSRLLFRLVGGSEFVVLRIRILGAYPNCWTPDNGSVYLLIDVPCVGISFLAGPLADAHTDLVVNKIHLSFRIDRTVEFPICDGFVAIENFPSSSLSKASSQKGCKQYVLTCVASASCAICSGRTIHKLPNGVRTSARPQIS